MSQTRKNNGNAPTPVFEDLGFSPSESLALQIKSDLYFAIHDLIRKNKYSSKELETIWNQPQPRISEFLNGKISKMSIEKLLTYLERLGKRAVIQIRPGKQSA